MCKALMMYSVQFLQHPARIWGCTSANSSCCEERSFVHSFEVDKERLEGSADSGCKNPDPESSPSSAASIFCLVNQPILYRWDAVVMQYKCFSSVGEISKAGRQ